MENRAKRGGPAHRHSTVRLGQLAPGSGASSSHLLSSILGSDNAALSFRAKGPRETLPGRGFPSPQMFSAERPQGGADACRNANSSRSGSGAGLEQPRFTGGESEAEREGAAPSSAPAPPRGPAGCGATGKAGRPGC